MVIVVLGMHRSGTSLVSRLIHEMGVNMGDSFLPPDSANPEGYYEDGHMLELNKRILGAARGTWRNPPSVKEVNRVAYMFREEIGLLTSRRNKRPIWGFKDPRTCLTISVLYPKLRDPRFVVVRRNKTAVQLSLERIHGEGDWESLYDVYNTRIDQFMATHPEYDFFEIAYEALLADRFLAYDLGAFTGRTNNWEKAAALIR